MGGIESQPLCFGSHTPNPELHSCHAEQLEVAAKWRSPKMVKSRRTASSMVACAGQGLPSLLSDSSEGCRRVSRLEQALAAMGDYEGPQVEGLRSALDQAIEHSLGVPFDTQMKEGAILDQSQSTFGRDRQRTGHY